MAFRVPASPTISASKTLILPAHGQHTASILFLHGLAQDSSDWIDFAADNFSPALPGTKFIFPTAPTKVVTMSRGVRMPAWYDITSTARPGAMDTFEGLEESREHINELIEQELAAGISPSRIILAGFSEGGAMALYAGLTLEHSIGGILVMSGYLPDANAIRPSANGLQTHIYQTHGDTDAAIPIALAKGSATKLKALGASKV
jgi:phospholipase/carboxylesterase